MYRIKTLVALVLVTLATQQPKITLTEQRLNSLLQKLQGKATLLGGLSKMSHSGNAGHDAAQTSTGGWTTGGALAAGSWDATHAAALVPWMNQVFADISNVAGAYNSLADQYNALLAKLQADGYMS